MSRKRTSEPDWLTRLLFWCILFVALAARVYKAWTLQAAPNPDFGIVALMAKHMAEAKGFPVFFYGQPYMGSLEPAFSALLCRLFGVSGFVVCLGSALISLWLPVLLYKISKEIAGSRAGLFAMAFTMIGSDLNYHYSCAPRGGYALTMVLGAAVLLLASRIALKAQTGQNMPLLSSLLLGLSAGIGWWTNQLIVAFLLIALVVLIYGVRWRVFQPGSFIAGLFFLIGSAPWWVWNLRHGWPSLQFTKSLGQMPFIQGAAGFVEQSAEALELSSFQSPVGIFRLIAVLWLALGFLCVLRRLSRSENEKRAFVYGVSVLGLILIHAGLYSTSHYAGMNAVRYVYPAFVAYAVILGVGAGYWSEKLHGLPAWIPFLLVLSSSVPLVKEAGHNFQKDQNRWGYTQDLVTFCESNQVGVLYGDYVYNWMNFASEEKVCIVSAGSERYAPYAVRAAAADPQAFIMNHKGVLEFLKLTCAEYTVSRIPGCEVIHAISPPDREYKFLSRGHVRMGEGASSSACDVLLDWNLDTSLEHVFHSPGELEVELRFKLSHSVSGLKLLSRDKEYPPVCKIDVLDPDSNEWTQLVPETKMPLYFWSADRIQHDGLLQHQEIRFEPEVAAGIRLTLSSPDPYTMSISELLILVPEENIEKKTSGSLDQLWEELSISESRKLYAPRSLMEAAYRDPLVDIQTFVPPLYQRGVNDPPSKYERPFLRMNISNETAIVCEPADADRTESLLRYRKFTMLRKHIGPWVVFMPDADKPLPEDPDLQSMYWTESGVFLGERSRFAKHKAHRLYERMTQPNEEELATVLRVYPNHVPAWNDLQVLLRDRLEDEVFKNTYGHLQKNWKPVIVQEAHFMNGVKLLGCAIDDRSVTRGEKVGIQYYWQCPPDCKNEELAVFVHFIGPDGARFQDDHVLLDDRREEIEFQPFVDTFVESRQLQIPPDIPPGEYACRIGLYNRKTLRRLFPREIYKTDKGAVIMPFRMVVE